MNRSIEVVGARTHNLRSVDCAIPRGKLTVVTGVSGSGKSSLAFDTVYAEGQRRYVETLSTYARQFLAQMRRPPVTAVRNVPPALALRQGNGLSNARSTVASVTELDDHLALLFARAGRVVCRGCGGVVAPYRTHDIVAWLRDNARDERVVVVGRVSPGEDEEVAILLRQLASEGYRRLVVDGELVDIDEVAVLDTLADATLDVVVDRLVVRDGDVRVIEAVEAALHMGEHVCEVLLWDRTGDDGKRPVRRFYSGFRCSACDTLHTEPIPALFHTQSALGACTVCEGYGRTVGVDVEKVVPNPTLSLEDGAVVCFSSPISRGMKGKMLKACAERGVPIDIPWRALRREDRSFVMRGDGDYVGVDGFFAKLSEDRRKPQKRIYVARFRAYTDCATCDGSGLSDDARSVFVDGTRLSDVWKLRVDEARAWADALTLDGELEVALASMLQEIRDRLRYLDESGVGYLTLDRKARTLSGGEMHRVLLATSVGRMLTDTCYVLDEPTAGLHAADTERLMEVIRRLRDVGNTVVVVEHDPDVIEHADWIIELGPLGGEQGGEIVYQGPVDGLRARDETTMTGRMLRARGWSLRSAALDPATLDGLPSLEIIGATMHNLHGERVRFAKGAFNCVTGVSGSGKSTLVVEALFGKLTAARGDRESSALSIVEVRGDTFDELVMVDQGSISRSSRSCALTYSGAYTAVRELFAASPESVAAGLSPGHFSFNTAGGRCDACEGTGTMTVEMHFIADIDLVCPDCDGQRFLPNVLSVRVGGKNIGDVFSMTVDQAIAFFSDRAPIVRRLEPLQRVGLGYVRLGQPTTQLSGGELQRLKLASYIGRGRVDTGGERLFIFDEPTVGLHLYDVEILVRAIRELTEAGHTVIVVEHNLDLVSASDWTVDLGPGPGPDGGHVVYQGPSVSLPGAEGSVTGAHLRQSMEPDGAAG